MRRAECSLASFKETHNSSSKEALIALASRHLPPFIVDGHKEYKNTIALTSPRSKLRLLLLRFAEALLLLQLMNVVFTKFDF